jgi:hypothetical protein
MAVKALDRWKLDALPAEVRSALVTAERMEPNQETRRDMQHLLRGERLPDKSLVLGQRENQAGSTQEL